jgi:hypothetical protein
MGAQVGAAVEELHHSKLPSVQHLHLPRAHLVLQKGCCLSIECGVGG